MFLSNVPSRKKSICWCHISCICAHRPVWMHLHVIVCIETKTKRLGRPHFCKLTEFSLLHVFYWGGGKCRSINVVGRNITFCCT